MDEPIEKRNIKNIGKNLYITRKEEMKKTQEEFAEMISMGKDMVTLLVSLYLSFPIFSAPSYLCFQTTLNLTPQAYLSKSDIRTRKLFCKFFSQFP